MQSKKQSDNLKTVIYQPNHVTNARYKFTLMQERIFTYIMFYLQHHLTRVVRGESIEQLDLFSPGEKDIKIHVPLNYIVPESPAQYPKVRQSAKAMASLVIAIPYKDKTGRKWQEYTGMFSVHIESDSNKRSKHVIVGVRKDIAKILIDMDSRDGKPQNYTSFLFEYAMTAKHKYTPRIYKLISSWKEKKVSYPIKLEELKAMIGCEGEYSNYSDFKKRVLIPAHDELKDIADCWFDLDYEHFETMTNGKVSALSFRVVTIDEKLTYCKLWNNIYNLLKTHFGLIQAQIDQLKTEFDRTGANPNDVTHKIMQLNERLYNNTEIRDPKSYIMKVLLKEFA